MKSTPDTPPHSALRIRLLGGFRVVYNGQPIDGLEKGRNRDLLAYLLLHRAAPISRQQLAFTLWPDTSDKQALTNLRTLLSRLRHTLVDVDVYVMVTSRTIQLRDDAPLHADLIVFEETLRASDQAGNDHHCAQKLAQAVAIYRGDLLPDCYDDWIAPARERLRDLYLHAMERLIAHHEKQRHYAIAIDHAQRLLRADPLHEATYHQLMRLHALNDDRAGALRVYHACVDTLQRELGVEPGTRIEAAYQRLLRRNATTATRPKARRSQAQLVGRNREWAALIEAWRRARTGRPSMVAITGEAGIGKTRLAEELVAWAERQGITVAVAHCYATECDLAYGPIAQWLQAAAIRDQWADMDDVWLKELARIVPQLLPNRPTSKRPDPLSARWQRQQLFEALAQALLADGQTRLLLIDDLQWSDVETLNWLQYLLQFDDQQPLFVLATVRLEDVMDEHRYHPFRLTLQRRGQLTEIPLGPLDAHETATLAGGFSSQELTATQTTELYRETEGNPLFVVETMQVGKEIEDLGLKSGEADRESAPNLHSLPAKVAAVLQQRLAQLSPSAQQLVQLAAIIGRTFTFDLLAAVCDQTEDAVVDALDEAWRRRIIREQGINAYDFSHDKLRTVAYAQISPIRRRYLHKRVATILAAQQTELTEEFYSQIAQHYVEAGAQEQAADYYHRAVDVAARRYAIESLLSASTKALMLFQQLDPHMRDQANLTSRAAIINERMWSWEMVGDMDAYLRDLVTLKEIGLALHDDEVLNRDSRLRAAVLIRLGRYREAETIALASAEHHRTTGAAEEEGISLTIVGRARRELGDDAGAISAFEAALTTLARVDAYVYQIQAYSYLSTTYWQRGDFDQALRCGEAALAICEEQTMPERKRFALGDMGAAAAMLGQETQARAWLTASLKLAGAVTDSTQEAFCRGHLGWLALGRGDVEDAARELQTAYALSQRADIINYASWLLRGLAEVAAARGQSEQAHAYAAEALAIAEHNLQAREQRAVQDILARLS